MPDLDDVRNNLEKSILDNGYTFRDISLKLGHREAYIHQYVKYGLPKRLKEVDRKKICAILNIDEKELIDDELLANTASPLGEMLSAEDFDIAPDDFCCVDVCLPGKNDEKSLTLVGKLGINIKEFSRWCDVNPLNLKAIIVNDDDMSPTIKAGALVFFDTSVQEYKGEGMYVVAHYIKKEVKRVAYVSKHNYYSLLSDNTDCEEVRCMCHNLKVYGEVKLVFNPQSF